VLNTKIDKAEAALGARLLAAVHQPIVQPQQIDMHMR